MSLHVVSSLFRVACALRRASFDVAMAWGSSASPSWLERIARNDPTLTSVHVLRGVTFDEATQIAAANALGSNTCVREFYASGRAVSVDAARAWSACLMRNRSLRSLCLGDDGFGREVVEDGNATSALRETLRGCAEARALERLDLENKGVLDADGEALGRVLASCRTLREIGLGRNPELGARGYAAALAGAREGGTLEALDLTDNALDEDAARALGTFLGVESPMKTLTLARCAIGVEGLGALGAGLRARAGVERLVMSGTKLGGGGAEACFGSGTTSTNIVDIELVQCEIEEARDVAALDSFLAASPGLRNANLRGNAFGDAGLVTLAKGAFAAHAPESLDLGSCKITARAVDALACAIKSSKALSLFDNADIGDAGAAKIFADASGSTLEILDLGAIGLTVAGLREISRALERADAFDRLRTLVLGGNPGAQDDDWESLIDEIRGRRPGLDVAWRAADGNSDDANRLKRDADGRVVGIE